MAISVQDNDWEASTFGEWGHLHDTCCISPAYREKVKGNLMHYRTLNHIIIYDSSVYNHKIERIIIKIVTIRSDKVMNSHARDAKSDTSKRSTRELEERRRHEREKAAREMAGVRARTDYKSRMAGSYRG